jgi:hypothetical protein
VNGHVGFKFIVGIVAEEARPPIMVNWPFMLKKRTRSSDPVYALIHEKARFQNRDWCQCSRALGHGHPIYTHARSETARALLSFTVTPQLGVQSSGERFRSCSPYTL